MNEKIQYIVYFPNIKKYWGGHRGFVTKWWKANLYDTLGSAKSQVKHVRARKITWFGYTDVQLKMQIFRKPTQLCDVVFDETN